MKQKKSEAGFFFTIDSILGIAVVVILLGAIAILGVSSQKGGSDNAMMHAQSSDLALKGYLKLKGGTTTDTVPTTAVSASCTTIYKLSNSGTATEAKVKKCVILG